MSLLDDIKAERKRREEEAKQPTEPALTGNALLDQIRAEQRKRAAQDPDIQRQLDAINAPRSFQRLPEARGRAGAFGSGVRRALTDIGAGGLQIGTGIAERLGVDVGTLPQRTSEAVTATRQRFEAETAERPGFGLAGEVAGFTAALPLAAETVGGAALLGGATGFILPTEGDRPKTQRTINTLTGLIGGAALQKIAPFITRGIAAGVRNSASIVRGVVEGTFGAAKADDFVTASGVLTDAGKKALKDADVNVDELLDAASQADDIGAEEIQEALFGGLRQAGEEALDPVSATRLARAQEQGIDLTSGQARQDFALQKQANLLEGLTTEEANIARAERKRQQGQVTGSVDKFIGQFGAGLRQVPKDEQGAAIKAAINSVRDRSRREVSDLYQAAEREVGAQIPVQIEGLADDVFFDIVERGAEPGTERALTNALAKFGLIGEKTGQKGANTLVDFNGQTITVRGDVTPLTLSNSEAFRKLMNKSFPSDRTGVVAGAIGRLDDAIEDTLEASGEGLARQEAFEAARGAFAQFKTDFSAKDIVDDLISFKKGTRTPRLDNSVIVEKIFRAKNSAENIIRVKNVLLATTRDEKANAAGRVAWREFQQAGVDDLFQRAISRDTRGDDIIISGAKLNSAINAVGELALRKLLTKGQFVSLKNLQSAVGDATIPIPRTLNPSESGTTVVDAMIKFTGAFPIAREGVRIAQRQAAKSQREAATRQVLSDIQNARPAAQRGQITPEQLARERALAEFIGRYGALPATRATQLEGQELTRRVGR